MGRAFQSFGDLGLERLGERLLIGVAQQHQVVDARAEFLGPFPELIELGKLSRGAQRDGCGRAGIVGAELEQPIAPAPLARIPELRRVLGRLEQEAPMQCDRFGFFARGARSVEQLRRPRTRRRVLGARRVSSMIFSLSPDASSARAT